jgi:hypothetical protein
MVLMGDSNALKVGQLVIAIGSPLGTYSNSVTSGIVSAKGRQITTDGNQSLTNLIQTDAAINPGNSGGPLLDADGNIVGINTAIASNSNGIGFAIPIDIARPIMAQAVAGEKLTRPYLGIRFVSITRQLADEPNLMRAAARICAFGPRILVIKRGEYGSLLFHAGEWFAAPAYPLEEVRDPTGAGDCFAGGFVGYLAGQPRVDDETLRRAMIMGSVLASFNVEAFSLERLRTLTAAEIQTRYQAFRRLAHFDDCEPLPDAAEPR